MRKFNYELHPNNEKYPVLKFDRVGKGTLTIPKVYHDTYTEIITSDWYENSKRTIKIDKETEMRIELYIRKQTIKLRLELVGEPDKEVITQPKDAPIKITIDDVPHEIDGTDLEVELPYQTTPYKVTVNKQFYEPLEFEFSLPSKESIVKEELKRKESEWVEKSRTETIDFEKKTEEDDQLLPSKSYVKVKGVNGSRRWDWFEEKIDGVMTNAKTKEISTVTKEPVTELYIQGTLKVEWKREIVKTETIPFEKKTVEDKDTLPEDSGVTTKGQDGERTYYREFEYANGKKTGGWRNETSEITTKVINEIYTKGTMVLEWREMSRKEAIPVTVRTQDDPNMLEGETRTVQGSSGVRQYDWEEEFKNGESTGRKRNETSKVTKEMVPTIKYVGTKQLVTFTTRYEYTFSKETYWSDTRDFTPVRLYPADTGYREQRAIEELATELGDGKIIEVTFRQWSYKADWARNPSTGSIGVANVTTREQGLELREKMEADGTMPYSLAKDKITVTYEKQVKGGD